MKQASTGPATPRMAEDTAVAPSRPKSKMTPPLPATTPRNVPSPLPPTAAASAEKTTAADTTSTGEAGAATTTRRALLPPGSAVPSC